MGTGSQATRTTKRRSPASSSRSSSTSELSTTGHLPSRRVTDARGGTDGWVELSAANTSEGLRLTFRLVASRRLMLGALALLVSVSGASGSCTSMLVDAVTRG